jgi:hypothetical protein
MLKSALIVSLLLIGPMTLAVTGCSGKDEPPPDSADTDTGPQGEHAPIVGTFFLRAQWTSGQDELEGLPGAIRLPFNATNFAAWSEDPAGFNWSKLDDAVNANAQRPILLTVAIRQYDQGGSVVVPQSAEEIANFESYVGVLVERYASFVEYWQLENEITMAAHWPSDGFEQYAVLLNHFHDVLEASNSDARVVVAGFRNVDTSAVPEEVKEVLAALAVHAPGSVDVIDLHHHRSWDEGSKLGERVDSYRQWLASEAPALADVGFVVAENSTWFFDPAPLNQALQTEEQQAIYGVQAVMSALGSGVELCLLATLLDRKDWQGSNLHQFALNGLYFNASKDYPDGNHSGPKKIAYAHRLLSALTDGMAPGQFQTSDEGIPGLVLVEALSDPPWSVVWWQGSSESRQVTLSAEGFGDSLLSLNPVVEGHPSWPLQDVLSVFASSTLAVIEDSVTLELEPHAPLFLLPAP